MIIGYLIDDTDSLVTCSLTSRSWYIAAVPHLHRTLFTRMNPFYSSKKTRWPAPLRTASKFGSLPFITRLFIEGDNSYRSAFSSKRFHYWTRREFSALTNVRDLSIGGLDIPSFIPRIRQFFGQFSPTVRCLSLREPKGSDRDIVFFIGLFQHLEDLKLHGRCIFDWDTSKGYPTLTPFVVPPFGGQLTLSRGGYNLARTMVNLFGGVRFRRMDLLGMGSGTQLLVYACADSLETLKLNATDICGEKTCSEDMRIPYNDFTGSYRDLDLSQNKYLRKLEITAKSLISELEDCAPGTVPSIFRAIISTVDQPALFDLVVVYREGDFYNVTYSNGGAGWVANEHTWYNEQFGVFREMYKAREFRLVLRAFCISNRSARELERAVATEKANWGIPPKLSMTYTLAAR